MTTKLGQGRFEYCFSVDGQWTHDPDLPAIRNDFGYFSNLIKIVDPTQVIESKQQLSASNIRHSRTETDCNADNKFHALQGCMSDTGLNSGNKSACVGEKAIFSLTEIQIDSENAKLGRLLSELNDDENIKEELTDDDDFPDLDDLDIKPGKFSESDSISNPRKDCAKSDEQMRDIMSKLASCEKVIGTEKPFKLNGDSEKITVDNFIMLECSEEQNIINCILSPQKEEDDTGSQFHNNLQVPGVKETNSPANEKLSGRGGDMNSSFIQIDDSEEQNSMEVSVKAESIERLTEIKIKKLKEEMKTSTEIVPTNSIINTDPDAENSNIGESETQETKMHSTELSLENELTTCLETTNVNWNPEVKNLCIEDKGFICEGGELLIFPHNCNEAKTETEATDIVKINTQNQLLEDKDQNGLCLLAEEDIGVNLVRTDQKKPLELKVITSQRHDNNSNDNENNCHQEENELSYLATDDLSEKKKKIVTHIDITEQSVKPEPQNYLEVSTQNGPIISNIDAAEIGLEENAYVEVLKYDNEETSITKENEGYYKEIKSPQEEQQTSLQDSFNLLHEVDTDEIAEEKIVNCHINKNIDTGYSKYSTAEQSGSDKVNESIPHSETAQNEEYCKGKMSFEVDQLTNSKISNNMNSEILAENNLHKQENNEIDTITVCTKEQAGSEYSIIKKSDMETHIINQNEEYCNENHSSEQEQQTSSELEDNTMHHRNGDIITEEIVNCQENKEINTECSTGEQLGSLNILKNNPAISCQPTVFPEIISEMITQNEENFPENCISNILPDLTEENKSLSNSSSPELKAFSSDSLFTNSELNTETPANCNTILTEKVSDSDGKICYNTSSMQKNIQSDFNTMTEDTKCISEIQKEDSNVSPVSDSIKNNQESSKDVLIVDALELKTENTNKSNKILTMKEVSDSIGKICYNTSSMQENIQSDFRPVTDDTECQAEKYKEDSNESLFLDSIKNNKESSKDIFIVDALELKTETPTNINKILPGKVCDSIIQSDYRTTTDDTECIPEKQKENSNVSPVSDSTKNNMEICKEIFIVDENDFPDHIVNNKTVESKVKEHKNAVNTISCSENVHKVDCSDLINKAKTAIEKPNYFKTQVTVEENLSTKADIKEGFLLADGQIADTLLNKHQLAKMMENPSTNNYSEALKEGNNTSQETVLGKFLEIEETSNDIKPIVVQSRESSPFEVIKSRKLLKSNTTLESNLIETSMKKDLENTSEILFIPLTHDIGLQKTDQETSSHCQHKAQNGILKTELNQLVAEPDKPTDQQILVQTDINMDILEGSLSLDKHLETGEENKEFSANKFAPIGECDEKHSTYVNHDISQNCDVLSSNLQSTNSEIIPVNMDCHFQTTNISETNTKQDGVNVYTTSNLPHLNQENYTCLNSQNNKCEATVLRPDVLPLKMDLQDKAKRGKNNHQSNFIYVPSHALSDENNLYVKNTTDGCGSEDQQNVIKSSISMTDTNIEKTVKKTSEENTEFLFNKSSNFKELNAVDNDSTEVIKSDFDQDTIYPNCSTACISSIIPDISLEESKFNASIIKSEMDPPSNDSVGIFVEEYDVNSSLNMETNSHGQNNSSPKISMEECDTSGSKDNPQTTENYEDKDYKNLKIGDFENQVGKNFINDQNQI